MCCGIFPFWSWLFSPSEFTDSICSDLYYILPCLFPSTLKRSRMAAGKIWEGSQVQSSAHSSNKQPALPAGLLLQEVWTLPTALVSSVPHAQLPVPRHSSNSQKELLTLKAPCNHSLRSIQPREPWGSSQAVISGRRRLLQWSWCSTTDRAALNTGQRRQQLCPQQPLLLCLLSNQLLRSPSSSG